MRKIANRLILQTVSILLIFAFIIAILFGVLFAKQTEDLHQEEMVHRSELISNTMADFFANGSTTNQSHGQGSGMGGYGAFLRFLNQIAGEEIWIDRFHPQSAIRYVLRNMVYRQNEKQKYTPHHKADSPDFLLQKNT